MPFLKTRESIRINERNLPHWSQENVTYFVTFRLADSIPQVKLRELKRERDAFLERFPLPHDSEQSERYYELFSDKIDRWLDNGLGECWLKEYRFSQWVTDSIKYFDSDRYDLGEWVVMPNHVHAVLTPRSGIELTKILHSWKSYSANKINGDLGRSGKLWQDESFNQILRSEQHHWKTEEYIRNNPVKAGIRVHHASFLD